MEEAEDAGSSSSDPLSKLQQPAGRRDERGRYEAEWYQLRVLKWAQLARRVPVGAIGQNINDVLRVIAPELNVVQATERQLQLMRTEVTIAGEALAAFRVALAKRILSFGFDESTKFGLGILSSNCQIEPHDNLGTTTDVILRGATLTAGGTSEAVAADIEKNIFQHARRLLIEWKAVHEAKFGKDSWATAGGPDPESIGVHRLSAETLIMSDTCNAARKAKRLLCELAEAAGKQKIGDVAWDAMSEEERASKCTVYIGDCHQHLRNIIINGMSIKATEWLKGELADDLAEFSSFDRMSVDGMDLIRAVFKELHAGGEYAKGKGKEFEAWRKLNHPSAMWMPLERASGSRQDLAFDGAVPIFLNRKLLLDFLQQLVSVPGSDNKLEKFIYRILKCNEMVALMRVCTLFKFVLSEPMRWLAGKADKLAGWSIDSSSTVLDMAEKALIAIAEDGHTLFDPNLDPFSEIADAQPKFKSWRERWMARTVKSPDGTEHRINECALAEARSPVGLGNKEATETCATLAELMAKAALVVMRDPKRAIADKLISQDGANAWGKNAKRHKATIGVHAGNCRVESNFAKYDSVARLFRGATCERLAGMAQQMQAHDFDAPLNIAHDRRKRKTPADEEDEQVS